MKAERVTSDKIWRIASCLGHGCWVEAANEGVIGSRSIEAVDRWAKCHAEKTGHTVVVESTSSFRYMAG